MESNYSHRETFRERIGKKFEKAGPVQRGEILHTEDMDELDCCKVWYERKIPRK